MRIISISGGATEIPALLGGVMRYLQNSPDEDTIFIGVSSGAILSLPLALGMFSELKEQTTSIELSDMFGKKPLNKKGKPTTAAILRVLCGAPGLGDMEGLKKSLLELVSKGMYDALKQVNKSTAMAMYVSRQNQARMVVNSQSHSYLEFIDGVVKSASVPVFVGPHKGSIGSGHYGYDGGVRNHIPTPYLIEKGLLKAFGGECGKNVKLIEFYSREQNSFKDYGGEVPGNIIDETSWTIQTLLIENSKMCENYSKVYCEANNIHLEQYFTGNNMPGMWDIDHDRLQQAYLNGWKNVREQML